MTIFRCKSGLAQKDNGGTVVYAGNVQDDTNISNAVGLNAVANDGGYKGNVLPAHSQGEISASNYTRGVVKPYSAGDYAKMVAGDYLIHGYSTKIAGQTNNAIHFAASVGDFRKSINRALYARSTFVTAYQWSAPAGVNSIGEPKHVMTTTYTRSNKLFNHGDTIANGGLGQDDESVPTLAIPGEFVLLETGGSPTQKDYPAKTN